MNLFKIHLCARKFLVMVTPTKAAPTEKNQSCHFRVSTHFLLSAYPVDAPGTLPFSYWASNLIRGQEQEPLASCISLIVCPLTHTDTPHTHMHYSIHTACPIYLNTHTHTHTYYTHIHYTTHTCTHSHTDSYIHIYKPTHTYTHIYIKHTYTYIHTYILTHPHTHIYSQTHTHTQHTIHIYTTL